MQLAIRKKFAETQVAVREFGKFAAKVGLEIKTWKSQKPPNAVAFRLCKKYSFRSWCIECPDRELILANVQYEHVLELLLAIHPTYKDIDDQTVHILLPLAFDYQVPVYKNCLSTYPNL